MCGIFGYIGERTDAGQIILSGLKFLEYRGYDSWGVVAKKSDGQVYLEKHAGKIGSAALPEFSSSVGIGHTRWATHGGVTDINAHPHFDCKKNVFIVHNGIIENYGEIKKELSEKGHNFMSDTDTEVAAHLLEEIRKTTPEDKEAVLKTFRRLHGLNALIFFMPDKEEFYAIKNGSPLAFGIGKNEFFLASDATALARHTKDVYFLGDNELLCIGRSKYNLYDMEGREKTLKPTKLTYTEEDTTLGTYPQYMIKEISEQPRVLQNIIDTQSNTVVEMAEVIRKAYGTYFIGCGSAYYAGLAGAYLFAIIAKRHVNCWSASEFEYLTEFLRDTSLVAALSQSGETMDVISSVKCAQAKQAKIMAITNNLGSTLYRLSDYKILLNAGPEICVVSTKVFTAKIAMLYLIAHELAGTRAHGAEQIKKVIEEIKKLLDNREPIVEFAKKIQFKEHVFILGRGVSYPAALEAALKIKEVSYIHAEGFAAGDLKHGVIALIEKDTPVIVFNPEDETYDDTLSSASEVKARGAYIIGVSSKNHPIYDMFIPIEYCEQATLIPNIVFAQLLGYHLALLKKLDPDKPRNLAKSVTVK